MSITDTFSLAQDRSQWRAVAIAAKAYTDWSNGKSFARFPIGPIGSHLEFKSFKVLESDKFDRVPVTSNWSMDLSHSISKINGNSSKIQICRTPSVFNDPVEALKVLVSEFCKAFRTQKRE